MLLEKAKKLLAEAKEQNSPAIAYLSLLVGEMETAIEKGETAESVHTKFIHTAEQLMSEGVKKRDAFIRGQAHSNMLILGAVNAVQL